MNHYLTKAAAVLGVTTGELELALLCVVATADKASTTIRTLINITAMILVVPTPVMFRQKNIAALLMPTITTDLVLELQNAWIITSQRSATAIWGIPARLRANAPTPMN